MSMDLYLIRLDGTYARYSDVVADPVLENMTGKGEPYRDIFSTDATLPVNGISGQYGSKLTITGPTFAAGLISASYGSATPDDVSHESPRQADQIYTFWKFEFATVADTPQYSYAEFRRGDIISNTAPNTDPTT